MSSSTLGRPSLVSKFPEIVPVATSFIKANGFSAHERHREAVGKVGVSIREIRDHLLANVPNLKCHGISLTSVAHLMESPRRGTVASTRYKALIAARVPEKRNQYREDHQDQHYLFTRVAYMREFSAMFSEECAIFSADDMNKIKVGALAVSRYHQIQRYFPTEDTPNVPDHDLPIPGYQSTPSGYMRLMSNPLPGQDSSILDGESKDEYRDKGINNVRTITMDTTAHLVAQDHNGSAHTVATPDIAGPVTTLPASTKITATASIADSVVSVQVENSGREQELTTVRVEVCNGKTSQVVSVSTTHPQDLISLLV